MEFRGNLPLDYQKIDYVVSTVTSVTSITIEVRQTNWNTLFCILNFVDSYLSYGKRLLFSLILLISFISCYFKIYKESIHTCIQTYKHACRHTRIHTKRWKENRLKRFLFLSWYFFHFFSVIQVNIKIWWLIM